MSPSFDQNSQDCGQIVGNLEFKNRKIFKNRDIIEDHHRHIEHLGSRKFSLRAHIYASARDFLESRRKRRERKLSERECSEKARGHPPPPSSQFYRAQRAYDVKLAILAMMTFVAMIINSISQSHANGKCLRSRQDRIRTKARQARVGFVGRTSRESLQLAFLNPCNRNLQLS